MSFRGDKAQFSWAGRSPLPMGVLVSMLLFAPLWSWAAGISFTASPEWKPLSPEQTERLHQVAIQSGGQFVDAGRYTHGGGAMVMTVPMRYEVNSHTARNYVAGMVHGVSGGGQKLLSQEPSTVGPLPGFLLTFRGLINGQPASMVDYVVFDEHDAYVFSISGPAGTTQGSPEVTSYLARVRFDPGMVPANLSNPAYELGEQVGSWLVRGLVVVAVFFGIRRLMRTPKNKPQNPQPPPLPL